MSDTRISDRDVYWYWDRWVAYCWANPSFWLSLGVGVVVGVALALLAR